MSETYDLYRDVHNIAKAIVMKSKGFGHSKFDADAIKADVDRASAIANVAENYWNAARMTDKAHDRLKAATTLNLDIEPYQVEYDSAKAIENLLIKELREIVENRKYYKDSWGNWSIRDN